MRSARWESTLAAALGLVMVAAVAEIVIDGSVGHSALIPLQPRLAGCLSGLGEWLDWYQELIDAEKNPSTCANCARKFLERQPMRGPSV